MIWHHRPPGRRGFVVSIAALGLFVFGVAMLAPATEQRRALPAPQAAERAAPRPATRPAAGSTTRPVAGKQKTQDFIRFVEDDDGGGRLESAIVTYRNAAGVTVHLVAALHVGEGAYYDRLTKTFSAYDALLYELIKPRGGGVPQPGVKTGGAVSGLQRFLKDVLELEFQLDKIDYSSPNFVHADLDAETFFELQDQRGESLLSLMFRSMLSEMQRQSAGQGGRPITIFDILAAMNSPDSARQYKLLLARQFQDIEAQIAGVEGKDGTVLVSERNKAALKVLKKTIAEDKKNIGVFYGAGHMRGLEDALLGELGFKRTGVEWRVAWDMTAAGADGRPATRPTTRATIKPTTRPTVRPTQRPPARRPEPLQRP